MSTMPLFVFFLVLMNAGSAAAGYAYAGLRRDRAEARRWQIDSAELADVRADDGLPAARSN